VGKEEVVLVDTSSWIEALRSNGDQEVRQRVLALMIDGRAAWCDLVAVELWNGARGDYERKKLAALEKEIVCLDMTSEAWARAKDLARKCRKSGITAPSADLVITACALVHGAELEHCDAHLETILRAQARP
jgi:predicted nucleic acid-binding protein